MNEWRKPAYLRWEPTCLLSFSSGHACLSDHHVCADINSQGIRLDYYHSALYSCAMYANKDVQSLIFLFCLFTDSDLHFCSGVGDKHRTMLDPAIADPMFTPPPYEAPKVATDIRIPKWTGTVPLSPSLYALNVILLLLTWNSCFLLVFRGTNRCYGEGDQSKDCTFGSSILSLKAPSTHCTTSNLGF